MKKSLVFWLLALLGIFYNETLFLLVDSGQGGHGDSQFLWMIVFALASFLSGGVYVMTLPKERYSVGLRVALVVSAPFLVCFAALLLYPVTFFLGRLHFCSDSMLHSIPSPTLGCECNPKNCGS